MSWTVTYGVLFPHTGIYFISSEVDTSKHCLFMQHLSVISVEFDSKVKKAMLEEGRFTVTGFVPSTAGSTM